MNPMVFAAALFSAISPHAFAQTNSDSETPAIATPDSKNANAPVEGKNSFTEAQATKRFAAAGYSAVGALSLDDKGVWHGMAMKDGKSVRVGLDYQGNVVAQ
ncbi:PepSY domain-containing protein [Rhizobium sp. KVB221]|uniref:PepSY domain-containing protein n=1 Tax=Rhizobium setariae TaxID=2801340 RepID=A0A936YRM6_9HYPH|nr:PepSY domain-containing protein [Rhizobium setariae]MBL0375493.1 PepSY domain-containing protein [Rhizobium setariae]